MRLFALLGGLVSAALVAGATSVGAVSVDPVGYTKVGVYDGNDCGAGGFGKCTFAGSPSIAKYNAPDKKNPGKWEVNPLWAPALTLANVTSFFTLSAIGTDTKSGTWSYNGSSIGIAITHFILKAGNKYVAYKLDTPGTVFTDIAWNTNDLGKKGLSHITFFDTKVRDNPPPIPLPAAGVLLLSGLGALGVFGLARRRAA